MNQEHPKKALYGVGDESLASQRCSWNIIKIVGKDERIGDG
jgi:hypothetical protein